MNYPSGIIWRHSWLICLILNVCRSRSVWNSMLPVKAPHTIQLCSPFPIPYPDIPWHPNRSNATHTVTTNLIEVKKKKMETAYRLKQSSIKSYSSRLYPGITYDWMPHPVNKEKSKYKKKEWNRSTFPNKTRERSEINRDPIIIRWNESLLSKYGQRDSSNYLSRKGR